MESDDRIFVAGHQGLVGSALVRKLTELGYRNLITRTRAELDLSEQAAVRQFFREVRPAYVFLAAGKVGGVYANNAYRADFIHQNMVIQTNVIHESFVHEVRKLVFFSCSCVFPRNCAQPMTEEMLLSGYLEPTNEPFAVAKIAGMKMCESYNRQYGADFISVIPTNVYGRNQSYDPMNSLVVPALIRKFHEARKSGSGRVVLWGSGRPSRDFLFAEDLADAVVFIMNNYAGNETMNIGTGRDYTIRELADIVRDTVGFEGEIVFDTTKPEGTLAKLQDVSRLSGLGWRHKVELADGIRIAYQDFLEHAAEWENAP
jgi:GDP-L-fucose synthase